MSERYAMDTNVLVSAAIKDGPARRLVVLTARTGALVTSNPILDEFATVMGRPPLSDLVPVRLVGQYISFMERNALIVQARRVRWDENPKDAAILGTALAADASLVTGDSFVLDQAGRFRVRALTVRAALDRIESI